MSAETPVIWHLMLYAAILTLNGSELYFVEDLGLYVPSRVTCTVYTCGTTLLNITKLRFWIHPKDLEMESQISFNNMLFFTKPFPFSSLAFVVKLPFCSLITEYYLLILKGLWTKVYFSLPNKIFLRKLFTVTSCDF